jgi:hypothetical protein
MVAFSIRGDLLAILAGDRLDTERDNAVAVRVMEEVGEGLLADDEARMDARSPSGKAAQIVASRVRRRAPSPAGDESAASSSLGM